MVCSSPSLSLCLCLSLPATATHIVLPAKSNNANDHRNCLSNRNSTKARLKVQVTFGGNVNVVIIFKLLLIEQVSCYTVLDNYCTTAQTS